MLLRRHLTHLIQLLPLRSCKTFLAANYPHFMYVNSSRELKSESVLIQQNVLYMLM